MNDHQPGLCQLRATGTSLRGLLRHPGEREGRSTFREERVSIRAILWGLPARLLWVRS